jgi:hypothetical protein
MVKLSLAHPDPILGQRLALPLPQTLVDGDNLYTTQTPECSKGRYNAKIRKQKSLLRSHQQPT